MGLITARDLFAPAFFRVWNDIYYKRKSKICLAGGRGCVSGDTLIDTPSGKVAIKDFKGGIVCTYDKGKVGVAYADRPTCHTVEMMRRVRVANGNEIKVTDEHVFLCDDGTWKMTRHLVIGDSIKVCDAPGGASPVVSVEECGYERYWDLQVNGTHNYIASGFVNHNSTKSSFVALCILLTMEMDRRTALDMKRRGDPKWKSMLTHAVVYRKVFGTCEQSVYSQLQSACEQLGLSSKYRFVKSPLKITRVGTGQTILFRGLDDPMKSRSIKFPYSFPRCVWFEEVSEFDGIEEIMDVARSIQRGGHDFLTFFSYNPPETSSNWVNRVMDKLADTDPTFGFYKSDYRTVPRHWLGDQFFHDAEILRRMNERQYRHVYLGEITGNGGTVFPNVEKVHLTDEEIRNFPEDNITWGADFGLRDPTTLVGCYYEAGIRTLTIFDEVYRSDMTLDDMYREFRAHHFGFNYIIGDCAAATIILSLRAMGLQIIPCKKGADSIMIGVKALQSLVRIRIDPDRCPHTYREFVEYEYEKNKLGEFTGRLPDRNNHCIDGVRYSCERLIRDIAQYD